jgi:DNA processing protein
VGVVGSRDCSAYGRKITEELVKGIADEHAIVSGLAKGIDTVAHETAIKYKGKTIAVLGSGIDYCYPKCNQELYKEIKENHLLISEYPGEVEPCPSYFPIRNRIVTGLSKALLVTEAYKMSGTLISVKLALEFGKTIMCVPYEADKNSMCNQLIKDGAYMVESCDDIKDLLR